MLAQAKHVLRNSRRTDAPHCAAYVSSMSALDPGPHALDGVAKRGGRGKQGYSQAQAANGFQRGQVAGRTAARAVLGSLLREEHQARLRQACPGSELSVVCQGGRGAPRHRRLMVSSGCGQLAKPVPVQSWQPSMECELHMDSISSRVCRRQAAPISLLQPG